MIKLESVKTKNKKRVGRGLSAGQGKTAGRGTKGQKSRSGHNIPKRFEGGQTPLSMRLPKLPGFKSVHKKAIVISLDQISENFKAGETVSVMTLLEKKMIPLNSRRVKVLNNGKLTVKVTLSPEVSVSATCAELFSADAKPEAKKVEKTVATETKSDAAKKPEVKAETKKPATKKEAAPKKVAAKPKAK